jgi:hypothetical protein
LKRPRGGRGEQGGKRNRRERGPTKLGDRDIFNRQEACDVLDLGLSTLAAKYSDKHGEPDLDSTKVGGKRQFTRAQLLDYMRRKGLPIDDE